MNDLRLHWQSMPFNYQVIFCLLLWVALMLVIAWAIQRQDPNIKEARLAAKRDRANARLKAHIRRHVIVESPTKQYQVGRDCYKDAKGVWHL